MRYKLARHARSGMHIVANLKKKGGNKGLCGRSVGQSYYHALSVEKQIPKDPKSDDHNGWCPACFGHYANRYLLLPKGGDE